MNKLNILWTTNNRDTITHMISMYAVNTLKKGLWDEVSIIVWGASVKLLGENEDLQKEVITIMEKGVQIGACRACCDNMGVTDTLEKLGIDVKYMGEPLTEILKQDGKLLTV
ncbi:MULTISPECIES: DsrE family protein [unclassified Lentimicrobium]|uniref:DsrE family protein n=1 Tax=unclassified Lentimicrobium TaxID=2677434 RepID=UPI0015538551|nr:MULTISPECIES: DsrE family protein [unclassified Lentimicrobium]NPD47305.1 DsrE family protein [Lentimicrobium sp. S6]NPD84698.1 DsrE family protein [Lentimicrobium sp. L6]